MRVFILNGPPGIGKDTLGNNIEYSVGFPRLEFKEELYRETAKYFGVDLVSFCVLATNRLTKEVPLGSLNGMSPRQAMIHVSEDIMKPRFGQDYFAAALFNRISDFDGQTASVVISDGGFVGEIEALIKRGCEVHIIQLHAEGFNFDNDSRDYVTVDGATVHRLNVTTGNPKADFEAFIDILEKLDG